MISTSFGHERIANTATERESRGIRTSLHRRQILAGICLAVVTRIGVPPPGYKYVRVANDILLIAIGTQMVIDAIQDLIR